MRSTGCHTNLGKTKLGKANFGTPVVHPIPTAAMVNPALALSVFALLVALLAVVSWPRRGVYARFARLALLTERVRLEDAIKHVYTWEQAGRIATLESLAGRLEISRVKAAMLLQRLTELGLVHTGDEGPSLSEDGRDTALRLVSSTLGSLLRHQCLQMSPNHRISCLVAGHHQRAYGATDIRGEHQTSGLLFWPAN